MAEAVVVAGSERASDPGRHRAGPAVHRFAGSGARPINAAPESALAAAGVLAEGGGGNVCAWVDPLRCTTTVRGFSSVIVVLDMGQLAAYVGLAQVNRDARDGAVPTILVRFQRASHPSQKWTVRDRALLYGLYNTGGTSTVQVAQINAIVLEQITP